MGALAITVVAGARFVEMDSAPMVDATRGLIAGASVFFWAFGTWLIPALVIAGYWRHVRHRVPLRYEATLWSIIFPLGMYGVGSQFLGDVDHLPIVHAIGSVEIWVALAAWLITFVAMVIHIWRHVLRR
jgi:tellurite resistance protein TehA-like permease